MTTTIEHITPIHNHIIFKFIDDTAGGEFISKTGTGIVLPTLADEQGQARWGRVIKCGPDCSDEIKPGTYILVDAARWSAGCMLADDSRVWRTDETAIALTSKEPVYRY